MNSRAMMAASMMAGFAMLATEPGPVRRAPYPRRPRTWKPEPEREDTRPTDLDRTKNKRQAKGRRQ